MAGWKELPVAPVTPSAPTRSAPPRRWRRGRILAIVSFILLIVLIFSALRFTMMTMATDDLLQVRIGDQQPALLDLHQSFPISPYLLGTNVFPLAGSSSVDAHASGFMHFTTTIQDNLQAMHMGLLRYPGGNWGEQHTLSIDQLKDFTNMLKGTGSEGMIQVRIPANFAGQPPDKMTVAAGASQAGRWVDYMNNLKSFLRLGTNDPYHPVHLWAVGNEPDRLINPATGHAYTVQDYVSTFIQYSMAMHQNDPTIKVFGPELSQFYGLGAGPFDASGKAWMEGFLQGVGAYQKAHPELKYHLLDGVSFHRYQFNDARNIPGLLMSSSEEWNYLLPQLREEIRRDLGYDAPIAITEINTNPQAFVPTRGQAALWWAETLGTLMNQQVGYVAFFSTSDVPLPYPLFDNLGTQPTPMLRVMQMFSHLQSNLVPLAIQDNPVSVYATQDNAHQTVSLLFVNKSNNAQLAQVDPIDQFLTISPWHHLDISLAADSIVVINLHRNASPDYADAYSYDVPSNNDATTQSILPTVCGQKQDMLSTTVPC
jgi:hypothetical protein